MELDSRFFIVIIVENLKRDEFKLGILNFIKWYCLKKFFKNYIEDTKIYIYINLNIFISRNIFYLFIENFKGLLR